jgi:hypothetical protein
VLITRAAVDAGATNWNAGRFCQQPQLISRNILRGGLHQPQATEPFLRKGDIIIDSSSFQYPEYLDKIYLSVKGFYTPKGPKET